jgi:hypothetical protein
MKLPNAENAIVAEDKIVEYLLDIDHRRGSSKAKLLYSLGYEVQHWRLLAEDILHEHLPAEVVEQRDTIWGKRYEIVAPITGPTGDTVLFRSIWQIDLGAGYPRLITMYPE